MNYSDYIVFVDESGDHSLDSIDSDYPVFVLCFCVIKKDQYFSKLVPNLKNLKLKTFGHDFIVLHESEIRKKKGAFSQLSKDPREAFLSLLTDLIEDLDFTLIAVIIDKVKHKGRYHKPEHPYHLALQFGLERLNSFLIQNGEFNKQVHVVCEARGPKEDQELELVFRRVCDTENRNNKKYPFSIVIADKKTNSEGLQIADLMARPIGLSVIKPDQTNRAYEVLKTKFYSGNYGVIEGNGRKVFP
jgi:hypothetical protein